MNWKCLFGLHDLKTKLITNGDRKGFTVQKYILIQCTRCKETFNV
jgi:hypothetical protein